MKMQCVKYLPLAIIFSFLCGLTASADLLELKNGAKVEGVYLGGDEETIKFQTNIGTTIVPRSEVVSLQIGGAAAAAPAPAATAPAAAPAPAPQPAAPAVVPAGTLLLVRMQSTVSSNSSVGTRFTAVLESDLLAGNTVVAKAGSQVYGSVTKAQKAGRAVGKSEFEIVLNEIKIDGALIPIMTTNYSQTGESSFKKTARGAAAGAIIGNNTGNGDAGEGAAIGVGVTMLKKGEVVTVSANSVVEFRLSQPLQR